MECSRLASTGRWELDKDHMEGRGLSTGAEAALLRRDPGSGLRGARGATWHGVRGRVQGLGANLKFILYTVPTWSFPAETDHSYSFEDHGGQDES